MYGGSIVLAGVDILTHFADDRIRFFYEEADVKSAFASKTSMKNATSPYELPIPFKE